MTLPTDILFPTPRSDVYNSDQSRYLSDLLFDLQNMYEQIAQNVNGTFRNDADVDEGQWLPLLKGTSTEGIFTYTNQYGWSLRQGIVTQIWGDIAWSATTATGNLYVELPYVVGKSNGIPFVGECQSSDFTYTAGTNIFINAITDTFRGEFWNSGSGVSTTNQGVPNSGRVIFHIIYLGVSDG